MAMLDGKAAIITGSGRDIGSATARLLGEQGAAVVVSDLDPVPAEEATGPVLFLASPLANYVSGIVLVGNEDDRDKAHS